MATLFGAAVEEKSNKTTPHGTESIGRLALDADRPGVVPAGWYETGRR